jgi:hypothetical protein
MKYLLLAAVAAGAIFLGVGVTPTPSLAVTCTSPLVSKVINDHTYCVPAPCASMSFNHVYIGTDGNDVIRITGSGRWFIDGGKGNDFIGIQAFNGPNCIVGGSGLDMITAGPFHQDVCVLNDGLTNTKDPSAGSESPGASDWAQNCKSVTPSPYPPTE